MKTTNVVALFLCSCLLVTGARAAALTNADDVLNFAAAKNAGYESFSTDFAQSMNMLGSMMKITGTMCFKKPAQMRMEMSMPMMGQQQQMTAVMGPDRIMWQQVVIGAMTNVMKMDFQNIPTNHPAAAMLKNPFENVDPQQQLVRARQRYSFELLTSTESQGQPMYVLRGTLKPDAILTPPEAAILGGMGQQRIYIGAQDGFMHRLEQLDKSGTNSVMTMDFTNLKFNIPLANELFIYKPAPEANVIDMTQMMLQMMQQQKPKPPAPSPPPEK